MLKSKSKHRIQDSKMDRRQLLKILAAAGVISPCTALLNACSNETPLSTPHPSISDIQRKSITILCDLFIPRTETPGAVDAGVPAFLEKVVTQYYHEGERQNFLNGLDALDQITAKAEQKAFVNASLEAQTNALTEMMNLASDYKPLQSKLGIKLIDENAPFFIQLKDMVVTGFYTSEVGMKEELAYLPMPMKWDGNYDYAKVGRKFVY
jgi:gluconate 2-dehydrogenase gamma chain